MKKHLLLLILPFLFTACSKDNEPDYSLFNLAIGIEAESEIAMGIHSAEISINGYSNEINVGIVGDYDSFILSDGVPSWLTVQVIDENNFIIKIPALSNADSRSGEVGFTVFKGSKSQTGAITIVQNALTLDNLRDTEQRAIKSYLNKFDIYDELPPINDIQVGSDAPFYKLDAGGNVYMQVVNMGSAPAATQGEWIYFRFLRYNLLSYFENGVLPDGEGNANDISQGVASFKVGSNLPSTIQWGIAIQLPIQRGLPVDSQVNLVVASEAGMTNEVANHIPFLYNIRYYKSVF